MPRSNYIRDCGCLPSRRVEMHTDVSESFPQSFATRAYPYNQVEQHSRLTLVTALPSLLSRGFVDFITLQLFLFVAVFLSSFRRAG